MTPVRLVAGLLLLACNALMGARLLIAHVRPAEMQPKVQYHLSLQMSVDVHDQPVVVKVFLPRDDSQQRITQEKIESHRLAYSMTNRAENRLATWEGDGLEGHEVATYEAFVDVEPGIFQLPARVPFPDRYPIEIRRYLEATPTVQADASEIRARATELRAPTGADDVVATLRVLYDFVHQEIRASDYEKTLDALTTLKWKEAFCGGKSRLLAALLRASNVPARLVGGLILTPGSKRISHVWLEAWVNGVWVPFDPLNDHFAEHPGNYLVLYRGDEPLFTRTKNVNFQYVFHIRKWRTPPDEQLQRAGPSLLNAYLFWNTFREAHISLNLLRIILLLPVGVLVVIVARNVIGLTTFGTFHPALMAVAFRDTGFLWGAALYVAVLSFGFLLRSLLDRMQLLHTPRVALLLTFVVVFMLAVTYGSVQMGVLEPAHVSLFPIAILAITVESYFVKTIEIGGWQSLGVMLQTLAVMGGVYWVLDQHLVQTLVFAFPELLLAVAAGYLVIGRFMGMRISEYRRFRWLLVE